MVIVSIIYKSTIKGQIKQVIQKDIEEQWTQYRALWDSTVDRGPVTARAHNFNPLHAIFKICRYKQTCIWGNTICEKFS